MDKPISTAVLRRPTFDLRFVTEDSYFHIVHNTVISKNNKYMTESVISMETTNALEDDSSAFSFTIAGDMEWSKVLNANDMVILRIDPNESTPNQPGKADEPKRNVVMIGLVSEVRLEGTYLEDKKMYRITGQSFAKAFINFELSTVRQVTYPMSTGWLNNPNQGGTFFEEISMKTVAETVEALLDRFLKHMQYNFSEDATENTSLSTRIRKEINSWTEDERLTDPTPFLNYEGSFNQMLNEVVTRPFCEMFFDVWLTEDGNEKAKFVVRRTPFDEEDWKRLHRHELQSRDVITESVAHTDLDAYSIFNIVPEHIIVTNTNTLVRPKYHPLLVQKYGYKMLEVSHKYLSPIANVDSTHGVGSDIIERYSQRLYNWYVNNPNFYTGDIVVIGHPDYRLGNRLLYRDTENHDLWEYYIESVQHSYSYVEGYKTTLGVTRGLRIEHEDDDGYRFLPIVGPSEDFEGGYFGEGSIADAISASEGQGQDYLDADTGRGGMGNMQNDSRLTRPAEGLLTSPYGMRLHPIHDVMRMHNGVDIAGGSRVIKAMASGVVTTVTNHKSLGRFVEIDHGNLNGRGKVTSLYAHLEQMHVHVGKQVTTGEQIGVMGTTGDSTGVHLHFELHVDGKRKDPEHWFKWTHA